MHARYADGRAAIFTDAACTLSQEGIRIEANGQVLDWRFDALARADDNNGRIILKRIPDTGERLMLELDAAAELRAASPTLFQPRAQGVERPTTVAAVIGGAWALAAVFLIGVPLMAAPIADVMPARYRSQIADISWSQVDGFTTLCDDGDEATRVLNDAAYRMMSAASVPESDAIWITIVDAPFPNAFALPDHSIIVTDDLIAMSEHPDELMGVIAHEIAHIEHNHVMTNVVRQIGAGVFFDVVFGGAGAGQAIAIASVNLAGLRYSRGDETDADVRGLEYLDAANIDTGGLARLFERFDEMAEAQGGEIPMLLSSHPASAERAAVARSRSREGLAPSLGDGEWRIVRSVCGMDPDAAPGLNQPTKTLAPKPFSPPTAPSPEPAAAPAPPAKPEGDLEGGAKP
jgi:beta-barrel assembly-enhancing protease